MSGRKPLLPRCWSIWTFWLYKGKGRISGIEGNVDFDLFNGSAEQLMAFAGKNEPASVPVKHVVAAGEIIHSIAGRC